MNVEEVILFTFERRICLADLRDISKRMCKLSLSEGYTRDLEYHQTTLQSIQQLLR